MVSRFTSSSMYALASLDVVAFRTLVDVGVTSGTLYFCSGNQFLFYSPNTYTPVGGFGSIDGIQEESDAFPRDLTFTLSAFSRTGSYAIGLDPLEPIKEDMFNRPVTVRRAFLDVPTMTLTVDPESEWKGTFEEINLDIQAMSYSLRAVASMRRTAQVANFNRETLQTFIDSSDTFANHIEEIPLFKGDWGGNPTVFSGGTYHNTGKRPIDRVLGRFGTTGG